MTEKTAAPYHLLFVDDEENILKALRRVFHGEKDLRITTAAGPQEASRILQNQPVDLVISDEKMPDISGHQFISFLRKHYPQTVRIILTGYSDREAILKAVNEGQVYRYLTKPWDDADLLVTVRKALEHSRAEKERKRLMEVLHEQNAQLSLQLKKRNEELEKALRHITAQRDEARKGLQGTAAFLNSIAGLIQADVSDSINRVVELIDHVLPGLGLPEKEEEKVRMIGYLYRIGEFAGSRETSPRETVRLSRYLLSEVLQTPEIGSLIQALFENWDGTGEPEGRQKEEIPLAARILRLAHEYDTLIHRRGYSRDSAVNFLRHQGGHLFDPHLTEDFLEALQKHRVNRPEEE